MKKQSDKIRKDKFVWEDGDITITLSENNDKDESERAYNTKETFDFEVESNAEPQKNKRFIQSCITNITFPDTIDGVYKMLDNNSYFGDSFLDIDMILNYYQESELSWTAPRWISKGDVIFFYHGVCVENKIKSLLKKARNEYKLDSNLIETLSKAKENADKYSGTIFACASVKEDTICLKDDDNILHFKSTIFAPLDEVYLFETPLSKNELYEIIKINRCGTITPLFGGDFLNVKKALSKRNTLPYFLENAYQAGDGFYNIDDGNWISISCSDEARFIDEGQVRSYFIDFLLKSVKDTRTPMLEECNCYRDNSRTGVADYFIKINNYWIPVEAKFNILFEKDIINQINKYMNIDSISPIVGNRKGHKINIDISKSDRCLVIDKYGIYTYINGKFTHDSDNPLIRREDIKVNNLSIIRNKICEALNLV